MIQDSSSREHVGHLEFYYMAPEMNGNERTKIVLVDVTFENLLTVILLQYVKYLGTFSDLMWSPWSWDESE